MGWIRQRAAFPLTKPWLDDSNDSRSSGDQLNKRQDGKDDSEPQHSARVDVAFDAPRFNCHPKSAHGFDGRTLPLQAILRDACELFV